ncbi:copper resistance D family protein [Paenibacillus sp. GCM10027627]|uniref:copper resistance D family protein n=1 Tax=unclassified Paenibacillus TaxID=185978 RepID=UPI00363E9AEF
MRSITETELNRLYIYFFETLLYLAFALTGGYLLLQFIPHSSKPDMHISVDWFQYALLGIPVFSIMSIIRTVFVLRDFASDMTFIELLAVVLKDYSYGNAWLWILILCTLMYVITQLGKMDSPWKKWALALGWLLVVLAHGWASHPAGFSVWGFISQAVHVGAVSVWLGVLILVAWFTNGEWNWHRFVRWYTPLSIGSMVLITGAGLAMMFILIDGYLASWGINYGQALLLKHLVFVPLLLLAFMNGFLTKLTDQGRNEQKLKWWLRAETLLALAMLIITAYMGVQEPPHEGEFEPPTPSLLFKWLHGSDVDLVMNWQFGAAPIACILIGIAALASLIPCYKRERKDLFIALLLIGVIFPFFGLLLLVG